MKGTLVFRIDISKRADRKILEDIFCHWIALFIAILPRRMEGTASASPTDSAGPSTIENDCLSNGFPAFERRKPFTC